MVSPRQWKAIVSKYQNPFSPRFILKEKIDGKWLWQASENKQVDITHWKLYWNFEGKELLLTMDEFAAIKP
ncbi:MAG: hypothetical protein PHG66_00260 [Candidatus Colwellbacteria bacterium]|nr:hypothetical protein [Candidatus Colwellbacteria bacterium]